MDILFSNLCKPFNYESRDDKSQYKETFLIYCINMCYLYDYQNIKTKYHENQDIISSPWILSGK